MSMTREELLRDIFVRALDQSFAAIESADEDGGVTESDLAEVGTIIARAENQALDTVLSGVKKESVKRALDAPTPKPVARTVTLSTTDEESGNSTTDAERATEEVIAPAYQLVRAAKQALVSELTSTTLTKAGDNLARWLENWQPRLAALLTESKLLGALEGAIAVGKLLDVKRGKDSDLPLEPQDWGREAQGSNGFRLHTIDRAAEWLYQNGILEAGQLASLASRARSTADRASTVETDIVARHVRDAIADAVRHGTDLAVFRKKLASIPAKTFLDPHRAETVFRTGVLQAYGVGQERVLAEPDVANLFPYRQYVATYDERTRREHREMEQRGIQGTAIYRADDIVWKMFSPPNGYNCRCSSLPVSIRQAAALGIREAQEWLATGKPPAKPAHVSMPPWKPDPGFVTTLSLVSVEEEVVENSVQQPCSDHDDLFFLASRLIFTENNNYERRGHAGESVDSGNVGRARFGRIGIAGPVAAPCQNRGELGSAQADGAHDGRIGGRGGACAETDRSHDLSGESAFDEGGSRGRQAGSRGDVRAFVEIGTGSNNGLPGDHPLVQLERSDNASVMRAQSGRRGGSRQLAGGANLLARQNGSRSVSANPGLSSGEDCPVGIHKLRGGELLVQVAIKQTDPDFFRWAGDTKDIEPAATSLSRNGAVLPMPAPSLVGETEPDDLFFMATRLLSKGDSQAVSTRRLPDGSLLVQVAIKQTDPEFFRWVDDKENITTPVALLPLIQTQESG